MGPLMICKAVQVILRGRPTGSQGIKGYAYWVPGIQGVSLVIPRGSKGGPKGSPGGPEVGPRGSRGRPTGLGESRGRPTGSQGVQGKAYRVLRGPLMMCKAVQVILRVQ